MSGANKSIRPRLGYGLELMGFVYTIVIRSAFVFFAACTHYGSLAFVAFYFPSYFVRLIFSFINSCVSVHVFCLFVCSVNVKGSPLSRLPLDTLFNIANYYLPRQLCMPTTICLGTGLTGH